jgi:hypothetical protein
LLGTARKIYIDSCKFAEIYIMKMSRNGCKFVMACNDFHKIKHKNKYNYREIKE